ncbi:MAG: AmmeMemoRadiSam system radical SAM enzyme [Promethearchaeota archaeon]
MELNDDPGSPGSTGPGPTGSPFLKRASFQRSTKSGAAQCETCEHRCMLGPGDWGVCGTRVNVGGEVFSTTFGRVGALSLNPIEKKPFFHFFPGTSALTLGSYGCNFGCFWCQNHDLSKVVPRLSGVVERDVDGDLDRHADGEEEFFPPDQFLARLRTQQASGTSFSFNEPTLSVEYALEVFPWARDLGFYNTFVSNGYMTGKVADALAAAGLDAINVDVKGGERVVQEFCGANVEHVWNNVARFKGKGVHVELTTLVIPGLNDDPGEFGELCREFSRHAGPETPWHLTRFFPACKSKEFGFTRQTPLETLERLATLARDGGADFVYIGNVWGHQGEHSRCPDCGALLVEREYPQVKLVGLELDGPSASCASCGRDIPGRWA